MYIYITVYYEIMYMDLTILRVFATVGAASLAYIDLHL